MHTSFELFSVASIPPSVLEFTERRSQATAADPRILVVDDEVLIADTIAQILNRAGFRAEAVYSGEEAIAAAEREAPSILLSDVLMPQVDGVEAAIAIREFCPTTRIILFSGQSATVEILSRASERGHTFELLPKPIHPTQLIQHLKKSLT